MIQKIKVQRAMQLSKAGDKVVSAVAQDDPEYVADKGLNSPDKPLVFTDAEKSEEEVVNGLNSGELVVDEKSQQDFDGRMHSEVVEAEKPEPKKTTKKKSSKKKTSAKKEPDA